MKKKFFRNEYIFTLLLIFLVSPLHADFTIRRFGDYAQILNPMLAGAFSLHEKGLIHYGIIFTQCNLPTWVMHTKGRHLKWSLSARPRKKTEGIRERKNYTGMPSGHTAAAWMGAAYMRRFSKDYQWVAWPLYLSAALTGYSRVHSRCHTKLQVFASIALVEGLNFLNANMSWSKNYEATEFSLCGDGMFRLSLKF